MRIVVSLTTVPLRAMRIGPTIDSLLAQTRRPDEIRLHLGPDCPPVAYGGVLVRRCHDYGPLTKLLPAIDYTLPGDALIVTVDDDMIYMPTWLEMLADAAEGDRLEAIGMSGWNTARLIAGGNYEFVHSAGNADVLEGFAGVAYRRGFFGVDILEAPSEFRRVDDVWISSYLARKGIPRVVIGPPMCTDHMRGPGLHTAPDFVSLNRRAAALGFAAAAPPR